MTKKEICFMTKEDLEEGMDIAEFQLGKTQEEKEYNPCEITVFDAELRIASLKNKEEKENEDSILIEKIENRLENIKKNKEN